MAEVSKQVFVQSVAQDAGVAAALSKMQPSQQSDSDIACVLAAARRPPQQHATNEAAFFAKHG